MALFRVTVKLKAANGQAKDDVQNVWHFTHAATDPGQADKTKLLAGLWGVYGGLQDYFAHTLSSAAGAHTLSLSRVNIGGFGEGDDVVTSPLATAAYGFTSITDNGALPPELAAVLSFNAPLEGVFENFGATRPRQRRRGRIYLGPLASITQAIVASPNVPTISDTFRTAVKNAIQGMDGAILPEWTWCVYSRAEGVPYSVSEFSIDNAFDVQRRRGHKASSRTVYPYPG